LQHLQAIAIAIAFRFKAGKKEGSLIANNEGEEEQKWFEIAD